jgi:methylamine methyltransferase corrinoid protein reductive activase
MALYYDGRVITGSTAAGPALEGQQITCGMLAMPGSISDVSPEQGGYRLVVLDQEMLAALGPVVDFQTGRVIDEGNIRPVGITGTGTIALMDQAMQSSLVRLPRIETLDGELHLGEGLFFTEDDLKEAGKAIGSIRAGHITLCREAGISLAEVQTAYMSGASGTYVDPLKAQRLGMIPPRVEKIYQVGNTSLAMARDLAVDPRRLDEMNELAKNLRQTHCMFAASKVFERVYILELSYWTEGMPFPQYQAFLDRYGYSPIPSIEGAPEVIRTVKRDIDDLGRLGLTTIPDIGREVAVRFEGCVACGECLNVCPEKALRIVEDEDQVVLVLNHALCNGVACRRCERACPEKGFSLSRFFIEPEETQ